MPSIGETDVYWVVGSDENVGKTTVASALIEHLNQNNAAIGFKPFSAGKFVDIIDAISSQEATEMGSIYGLDGVALRAASPLINNNDIELTQPIMFICYPNYANPLLVRAGSHISGKVEYWRGPGSAEILKSNSGYFDPQMNEKFERFADAPLTQFGFQYAPNLDNGHIDQCLNKLIREKAPKTIVIEGAGKWLPAWKTKYLVNHILYIHMNKIYFFKNINTPVSVNGGKLAPVTELLTYLKNRISISVNLPFAPSQHRKDVASSAITSILKA